jgi:1-aminocyclopropane-1-carboxylate deaminase/D-cysteine desulfhydrase-like pyridoxal-dependent ACC family enzyme
VQTDEIVTGTHSLGDDLPLYRRFPALRGLPRVSLCTPPSPVHEITGIPDAPQLWVKRDDFNAPVLGGNKVRALEFLLGEVRPGDTVLTLGGAGSTHVLSTAVHARRIGAETMAMRWKHDMNNVADAVSDKLARELKDTKVGATPIGAIVRCGYVRLTRNVHFIPIGGTSPLGALGHVNAGLELAGQIERGDMPKPNEVVLPVATGGTMAGIALGLAIAGMDIPVVGARVGPRMYINLPKVHRIARDIARLIAGISGVTVPMPEKMRIIHGVYGGAYGRPLAAGTAAAGLLERVSGIRLDDTYSAKAFVASLDFARMKKGPTLFWLTFDARCLSN